MLRCTLILNSGYVLPNYDVTLGNIFPASNHGASIFLVPLRFLRKSSLIILMCMPWRVPTGEPIANPIKWKTCLYTGLAISIILGYWTCL